MKARVFRKKLLQHIQSVQNIVSSKTSMPVLSHVLLSLKENSSKEWVTEITATDMETQVRIRSASCIAADDGTECGSVLVPARPLFNILKNTPDDEISLLEESGRLQICGKSVRFSLVTVPPEEFPSMQDDLGCEMCFIPEADKFCRSVSKASLAMSKTDERYGGLYVDKLTDAGILRFVSTDSFRLVCVDFPVEDMDKLQFESGVFVPALAAAEIEKLFSSCLSVHLNSDGHLFVVRGQSDDGKTEVTLCSRLMERKFPDYKSVMQLAYNKPDCRLFIPADAFKNTLKRVSVVFEKGYFRVGHFTVKTGSPAELVISAFNEQVGSVEEVIPVAVQMSSAADDSSEGKVRVAFNVDFLLEIISALDGETVVFDINTKRPCVISSEEDKGLIVLIAPVKLEEDQME